MDTCPHCSSENIYYSKKRKVFVCEDCDETFTKLQPMKESRQSSGTHGLELFFSYGHDRNRLLVERIKRDLEKRGHHVWIDTSEIKAGDHWRDDILNGVLHASSVIAFLSEHSTRNPGVCLDELKIAVCVKGADIKTVLLEPENRISPPATISNIQWLDMSDWYEIKRLSHTEFERWYSEKFAELCQVVESSESVEMSGDIHILKQRLSPYLNSEKEYSLLSKEFFGRKWLEESIERWQDGDASKSLIIYGRPGSGKSAFCVNYAHYNADVYGCFLCEWNREHTINPKRLIMTMAFRLATKLPDYRSMLLRQLEDDVSLEDMDNEALFGLLLAYPLSHLVDGGRETGIIMVDGLDEAEVDGANPLAEVFSRCVDRLPRWIKFVFTSRPEISVSKHFGSCQSIDIVNDMPSGYDDIKGYYIRSLESEFRTIPNRLETLNKICDASDGIFLYAELLVADIKDGIISLRDTHSFPQGLNSFYRLSMERKFPSQLAFGDVRDILELLSIADTIPEELIRGACRYSTYAFLMRLDKLGSWVSRFKENGLYLLGFSHKSIRDWFGTKAHGWEFYIDHKEGALRLARYCRAIVDNGPKAHDGLLYDYVVCHVGSYYIASGQYGELEQFLLEHVNELDPYWIVWNQFPPTWDHSALLAGFWSSRNRLHYLKKLQREGNVTFLNWLFGVAESLYNVSDFDEKLVSIYMDIVHMSGQYAKAVDIADQYIGGRLSEVSSSEFLSMLSVRRLHHSMFFRPTRKLLDDALALYTQLDDRFPVVYNELLFLIGGNLGVLYGDWEFCRTWLDKSMAFAKAFGLEDFKKRNARKNADYYCHMRDFDKARHVLQGYMSTDNKISGRYEAYLVGALANLHTCMGNDDEALACYERLLTYTMAKGIVGWTAHANLGFANINFKLGNIKEAVDFTSRAYELYNRIKQEWGLIMCEALQGACDSRMGIAPIQVTTKKALLHAQHMDYGSSYSIIKHMVTSNTNYLELYFL